MYVPIKFPSDAEVIAQEVARFRALSPQDRVRSIVGLVAAGALIMARSPQAAFMRAEQQAREGCARQAVKEFLARHAR